MLLRIYSQQISRWILWFCFVLLVLLLSQTTSADKNEISEPEPYVEIESPPAVEHSAQRMNEDLDEILKILDEDGVAN